MQRNWFVILVVYMCVAHPAWSSSYYLPENGDNVVGNVQYMFAKGNETLLDIARRYNVGYNEIVAANPGINPWLPNSDNRIKIPSQFILPPKPWHGLVINLPEMRLYYFPPETLFNDRRVITMPLSIGKINWSTPAGNFYVKEKIKHPSWTVPKSIVTENGLERYGEGMMM